MLVPCQLLVASDIARKNDTCLFKAKSMRVAALAAAIKEDREGKVYLKTLIRRYDLPCEGAIRYLPPIGWNAAEGLPKERENGGKGFIDRFGNVWVKGPSRTAGERFEWDVQLSNTGLEKMEQWSKDGDHVNVSLNGTVTHGAKDYDKWLKAKKGKAKLPVIKLRRIRESKFKAKSR